MQAKYFVVQAKQYVSRDYLKTVKFPAEPNVCGLLLIFRVSAVLRRTSVCRAKHVKMTSTQIVEMSADVSGALVRKQNLILEGEGGKFSAILC